MPDLSQIPESMWREAQRRSLVVRPLLAYPQCSRRLAQKAAAMLGLSERHIYRLIQQLRAANGELTALLPKGPKGGRGQRRLSPSRESLLQRLIHRVYLTRQKRSAAELIREIRSQSLKADLTPPSDSTILRRLKALSLAERRRRGEETPQAKPIIGATPEAAVPMEWLQMDHTLVDLILVDPVDRAPIGRPWITLAIDVFSRCVAGFHLSLEAPSATSVGLCLTQVAGDKAADSTLTRTPIPRTSGQ